MSIYSCRLCGSELVSKTTKDALNRDLFFCLECSYVFVAEEDFLTYEEERERYGYHKNSIDDEGYVAFLNKLLVPLKQFLTPQARVLDYGSGPEPVLAQLLKRGGFETTLYDSHFSSLIPEGTFNVITSTEVFEHLRSPKESIEHILSLLNEGGILGIMTLLWGEETDFSTWHYTKDPTHVGFFSDKTFIWLEKKYQLERLYSDGERVTIFRKK